MRTAEQASASLGRCRPGLRCDTNPESVSVSVLNGSLFPFEEKKSESTAHHVAPPIRTASVKKPTGLVKADADSDFALAKAPK